MRVSLLSDFMETQSNQRIQIECHQREHPPSAYVRHDIGTTLKGSRSSPNIYHRSTSTLASAPRFMALGTRVIGCENQMSVNIF